MVDQPGGDRAAEVEELLDALGGKYAARVLAAADSPMSAQEISETADVPIATCYRRIEELVAVDLLACEGGKTSDRGRHTNVYRRTIDGLELDLADGHPVLDVDARDEPPDPLRDRRDE